MTYSYGYDDLDLYVEQGTERVPDDGLFYLVLKGKPIEHEPNLKRALARLQQLRSNPPSEESLADGSAARARMMQGEMAARHLQQSTSEKTAQFGGKGRKA